VIHSEIKELHRDFRDKLPLWATPGMNGNSVLFDMRTSAPGGMRRNFDFTKAAELVQGWVQDDGVAGPFRWDGSPILRRHVHNAKMRPNQWGCSLGKVTRDSFRVVDAATAMVGAILGARLAGNSGKAKSQRRPGKGRWGFD
jgi:hypothetical protein